MANTKLDKPLRWIRWKAFGALGVLAGLFVIYFLFLFDWHLKTQLEKIASALNRAQVNIGELHTSLLRCTFELRGLEITDVSNPERNLFEIDRVHFKFKFGPLLRKKIFIRDMTVEGIHFGTERKSSGFLPAVDDEEFARPGLTERVASGFYADIRNEIGENPLRTIGQLVTGIDLTSRVDSSINALTSQKRATEIRQKIQSLASQWSSNTDDFPSDFLADTQSAIKKILQNRSLASEEKAQAIEQVKKLRSHVAAAREKASTQVSRMSKDLEPFGAEFAALDRSVEDDVKILKDKLKLPRLDFNDLTPMLLGSSLLTYLERLTYWVDLSRRRMPKGSRHGQVTMVAQERSRGITVHFGKMAAYPAFLLGRVSFTSELANDTHRGRVSGFIEGLTSDPPIYGKPAQISLTADFPGSGIKDLRFEAIIDHSGEATNEEFHLSASSFPISRYVINDSGDVKVGIEHGTAKIATDIKFSENELTAQASGTATDIEYRVNSRYKRLEDTIKSILSGVHAFNVEAVVSGPLDQLKFKAKSDLGVRLASGLQVEFKHQILAIEDDLRKNILDHIYPQKEQCITKLRELQQKKIYPAENYLKSLEELEKVSDEGLARLEARAKPGRGRRMERLTNPSKRAG